MLGVGSQKLSDVLLVCQPHIMSQCLPLVMAAAHEIWPFTLANDRSCLDTGELVQCYSKSAVFQASPSRMFLPTRWLHVGRSKVLLTNHPRVDSAFNSRLANTLALKCTLVSCKGNKDPPFR